MHSSHTTCALLGVLARFALTTNGFERVCILCICTFAALRAAAPVCFCASACVYLSARVPRVSGPCGPASGLLLNYCAHLCLCRCPAVPMCSCIASPPCRCPPRPLCLCHRVLSHKGATKSGQSACTYKLHLCHESAFV